MFPHFHIFLIEFIRVCVCTHIHKERDRERDRSHIIYVLSILKAYLLQSIIVMFVFFTVYIYTERLNFDVIKIVFFLQFCNFCLIKKIFPYYEKAFEFN